MATEKKEELKMVQVGKNLNVTLGEEKYTVTGDKETLTPIKDAVKAYDAKPTKDNKKKMLELLKPITTEVEGMKERIRTDTKKIKNEIKSGKIKTDVKDVVKNIEDKEFSQVELESMERAIQKAKDKKKVEPIAREAPTSRYRRGEY